MKILIYSLGDLSVKIIKHDPNNFNPNLFDNKQMDYKVKKLEIHPEFNNEVILRGPNKGKSKKRINNNIAVLVLEDAIDLQDDDGVNAACYPG